MGLDTSHDAWHGGYGRFDRWRVWLAWQIGIPLDLMEGFYDLGNHNPLALLNHKYPTGEELDMHELRKIFKYFPLKWSAFKPNALHSLLDHSDCDGYLNWSECKKISKELTKIISDLQETDDNKLFLDETKQFLSGCNLAVRKKEKLIFG